MPVNNLTRDEARERARLLDVECYTVEIDLTRGEARLASTTVVRFGCADPGAESFIDLTAPEVREITLNGRRLDPAHAYKDDRVTLDDLDADNELRIVADCAYTRTGAGLHRFVDPVDGRTYLYSQFETADAHRVYACFDQPDIKAAFELSVTCPGDWQVVSNAAPDVSRELAGDDAARWHFPATPRIATYITAVIAGPYHVTRDEYDGTPLGVYCRASLADYLDAKEIIEVTRQGLEFYERVFGVRYPFGKYDQLFVPEFNAGAMENAGAVTFLEDYVFRSRVTDAAHERRAETILHEMAHMWFGDLVTMRWWDDLWLNESFATFMSLLSLSEATRWTQGWTTFANLWKTWAYRQDQLPSTHPIAADIPDIAAVEVNFDGITYAKGAAVLKQLVAWVGKEEFLSAMGAYFRRHAWGNTTLHDLLSALEEASGRDLASWSKQWLETAGVNVLRAAFETDADGRFTSFAVLQEAPPHYPTLRSHRLAVGLYDHGPSGLVRRERIELDVVGDRTEVPRFVGVSQPDLVLLNDDDLTYAKIRLDDRSMRTIIEGIGQLRDSLPRALCWGAAWDMCRDAELATRDYVLLVLGGLRGPIDIGVTQTLLRQTRTALQQFAAAEHREEGLRTAADTVCALLYDSEAGSDHQLAYAQAFAAVARTPEHLHLLRGLLDGSAAFDGLTIDTDLRWALLHRLVACGAAGGDEIDAELSRDTTAAGERHASAARAARADADAKAWAWEKIVSGTLPNHELRAMITGFQQPDQRELIAPYAERYFEVVGRIWRTWPNEIAKQFAVGMYPSLIVNQRTVDLTDGHLGREAPPPALRRLLLEGRAGILRALRARERDQRGD
ncbi:MAG: aminopeptidase N [Streptosporangiaceae bacterium]